MDCRFFVFCGCKFVVGDYDDYGLGWEYVLMVVGYRCILGCW